MRGAGYKLNRTGTAVHVHVHVHVCLHFQIKIDLQVLDNPTQNSNKNQLWTIIIRPTFPFFSGPKFELLCESRLGWWCWLLFCSRFACWSLWLARSTGDSRP